MEVNFSFLNATFHAVCIISCLCCVGKCFYNYSLDLDVSLVEHRKFWDGNDYVTPAISLCLFDPFSEDRFNETKLGVNKTVYTSFLYGKHWEEKMLETDFNSVTKSLEEYLNGYWIHWRNLSYQFVYPNEIQKGFSKPYLSYSGFMMEWLLKCYSVDIPVDAMTFGIFFRRNFFPNSTRPSFQGFGIILHYPNQFLKSVQTMKMSWEKEIVEKNHSSSMQIKINDFEVTIRRNSKNRPCNHDLKNDDYIASESALEKLQCHPPYYNWKSKFTNCNNTEQMARAKNLIFKSRNELMEPCQSAEKIIYDHQDLSVSVEDLYQNENLLQHLLYSGLREEKLTEWLSNGYDITLQLPENKYKAIVHKEAYDFTNLIGNSGGYIGLFLGK